MIKYSEGSSDPGELQNKYASGSIEPGILKKLMNSDAVYTYSGQDELVFELALRRHIIDASLALYRGRLAFRVFYDSFCNEEYWRRNPDGGFTIKEDVKPSAAVDDIFQNARKYGVECATAIVIVYYKAVLDAYRGDLFDRAFSDITLMNWQQLSGLLGVATYRGLEDYLPGDCRYFKNPEVNPLTPEWQGENAIDLGDGRYYGHGMGIAGGDRIISALNANRVADATVSAYLMDTATRPDFKGLYRYA